MINIIDKKNRVRELINQSLFCKLLNAQKKLLRGLDNLPDEIDERDIGLIDAIQMIVESSENDPEMQETIKIFLRLEEIKSRRTADPKATIDDLTDQVNLS
ncbi:MAG: hypothetical protein A2606_02025 [Candidatus Yanofskybacteria bacterium RIFOXYD1_FULL_42_10]|uniref:Uncharacterized protein n=1 Tax=Candidatus Yanofskybacteria bacterium RIFOXYD1_FULL_42_10 TaxID=1802718 RepID=A0A1F8HW20_9BACT|nr:MAG: hypothetical protein A3C64_01095 [Candidatus Yanofskybacteria bacterium RIFCSPHIGHO2_02_FULL_41_12]OGN21842.1 MAG: hypothetical protein A3B00_01370 [Candidatus Yanofskybacteria bacterium RIFCSPLOWO2_01_FULL_41_33]OGN41230.1 MAG: hypothetical protein A2606_02025 [Candidatus Yanofskybacteria bacterium RIFOXYD1_FULL_42_10]